MVLEGLLHPSHPKGLHRQGVPVLEEVVQVVQESQSRGRARQRWVPNRLAKLLAEEDVVDEVWPRQGVEQI